MPAALIIMALVVGCSSGGSDPAAVAVASPEPTPQSAVASPEPEPTAPTPTTQDAETPAGSALHPAFGLEAVTLKTAASGGGNRPLLEWEPVEAAFMYSVVLLTPSGEAYWAWEGKETSIHVGGEPQLNENASGPSVVAGMTWSVAAYDDRFHAIAISEPRSISP